MLFHNKWNTQCKYYAGIQILKLYLVAMYTEGKKYTKMWSG